MMVRPFSYLARKRCWPDALDRRVQVVERGLIDLCRDLGAGAARAPSLVYDDRLAGLLYGLDYGPNIERVQCTQIDNLSVDSFVLERVGGGKSVVDAFRVGHDRHVLAWA